MFLSPKIAIPVVVGVVGTSVAAATTISTGVFSSPEKCWYDDDKAGDFLAKVEKIIKENPNDQKNFPNGKKVSDLKDLIASFCTMDPESSLDKFDQVFDKREGNELLNGVFGLLLEKWSEIHKQKNLKQDEKLEQEAVL